MSFAAVAAKVLRWLTPRRRFPPTREGWWFLVATLLLGLAAINAGLNLLFLVWGMMLFLVLASGVLFLMQERVLVSSNREADKLERTIRHWPEVTNAFNRRWMVGSDGEMYHYDFFDQRANRFTNLLVYRLDEQAWRLRAVRPWRGLPQEWRRF